MLQAHLGSENSFDALQETRSVCFHSEDVSKGDPVKYDSTDSDQTTQRDMPHVAFAPSQPQQNYWADGQP